MRIDLKECNIHIVFEVSEDNTLSLLHFSNQCIETKIPECVRKAFPAVEIHMTGTNQNAHHGAKHIGAGSLDSLKYVGHQYYQNGLGNKLEIELRDDEISATLHYQFYNNISVVRTWTSIQNISSVNIGIEYISSFSLTGIGKECDIEDRNKLKLSIPHNAWCREVDWKTYTLEELGLCSRTGGSTKRLSFSNTGTWSTKEYLPMGAITDVSNASCLMWQIESNGSWQWEISDISKYLYLKLSGPTENENHWYKELKSGDTFESVRSAVAMGVDFNDALKQLTLYRRKIVRYTASDAYLPVIFNDYMNCLGADPTTEKEFPIIDRAAEAGAEYYCMDAGWYADGAWWETVGEWQPCEWRFPNGIKEVFDYIRSKGMIPGIWLEIECMGINCPILPQFTDDCFFVRHGKRVIDHGRYQMDFRNVKVRRFATEVVDRIVTEYGVGYIKMDYNIDGGTGTENAADSFGDGLMEHKRAYSQWIANIMDKYPELIIENCSSGGMCMDYARLSQHSIQSVTDQSNYRHMIPIAAACASAVLPEQAAIWSYPVSDDDKYAVVTNMVNSMLTRMHLSGEITKWSDEQFALVKEGIQMYKLIRGSIKESIPFYPIGVESYQKKWCCTGYRNAKEIYLAVWRMDTEEDSLDIPLMNLCVSNTEAIEMVYPIMEGYEVSMDSECIHVILPDRFCGGIIRVYEG